MLIITFTLSFLLTVHSTGFTTTDQETVLLNKGLELKKEGKYLEALSVWEQARGELDVPSLLIARAHIELTTEQGIDEAYQIASSMYFWGLGTTSANEKDLKAEMGMIRPIIEQDVYETWEIDFKENPLSVLSHITQYWTLQDITPNTPYNELLMEHWERIAHARAHFRKNDNTVYSTDDRGLIWVKYGKPDRIESGIFSISGSDIEQQVLLRLDTNLPDRGDNHLKQNIIRAQEDRNFSKIIANEVLRLAADREYEIWVYNNHNVSSTYKHTTIFGNTVGRGYAKALSIYDFIPASASSFSNRLLPKARAADNSSVTVNEPAYQMTPAVFMQLEYLRQIASVDPKFGQQFAELRNTIFKAGEAPRRDEALQFKRQHDQVALQDESKAPTEESTYIDEFPSIPIQVYSYRLLDDSNTPFSLVYLESQPQGIFILDETYNADVMEGEEENTRTYYDFIHGLQIRGSDQRLLASQELRPDINIDIQVESPPSISIFQIPYVSPETWEVYFVQLKNSHPETKPEFDSPFPNELRGLGIIKQKQPAPLETDTKTLVMSDAILGYDLDPVDDGTTLIPFNAAHNKEIPEGENLVVHYELYHLKTDQSGIANIEIGIEIIEQNKGFNRLRNTDPDFTLTLNQQSDRSFFRENLQIKTSDLEKGNYTLRMSILDTTSNQEVKTDIKFSIIEVF